MAEARGDFYFSKRQRIPSVWTYPDVCSWLNGVSAGALTWGISSEDRMLGAPVGSYLCIR